LIQINSAATATAAGGLAVSVRRWDRQSRQAMLLAAPYQVMAQARAMS
jgi:hypothetical protein